MGSINLKRDGQILGRAVQTASQMGLNETFGPISWPISRATLQLEAAKYRSTQFDEEECQEVNLSPALDHSDSWALCPDGYFFHGLNPGNMGGNPSNLGNIRRQGFVLLVLRLFAIL